MLSKLLDFLTLNYQALKGVRTVAGLLMLLGPQIVERMIATHCSVKESVFCFTLQAVGAWFLSMGIRGK